MRGLASCRLFIVGKSIPTEICEGLGQAGRLGAAGPGEGDLAGVDGLGDRADGEVLAVVGAVAVGPGDQDRVALAAADQTAHHLHRGRAEGDAGLEAWARNKVYLSRVGAPAVPGRTLRALCSMKRPSLPSDLPAAKQSRPRPVGSPIGGASVLDKIMGFRSYYSFKFRSLDWRLYA